MKLGAVGINTILLLQITEPAAPMDTADSRCSAGRELVIAAMTALTFGHTLHCDAHFTG